jgi:hypothetical protein
MATSPSHKFGQLLGDLLEEIMLPQLQDFCKSRGLYLDKKGDRPARAGKKLTWLDKYENSHDLDFVIEKDGTEDKIGRPVAFIEKLHGEDIQNTQKTKCRKFKVQFSPLQTNMLGINPLLERYWQVYSLNRLCGKWKALASK